jgi:hypothetical protein
MSSAEHTNALRTKKDLWSLDKIWPQAIPSIRTEKVLLRGGGLRPNFVQTPEDLIGLKKNFYG